MVLVLLAGMLISSQALGQASDPWRFPGGEKDKRDAEKKYGTYWYEIYPKAVTIFKGGNPSYDEVIARLRLAVAYKPVSGCNEIDPRDQAHVFVPYYWLAQAFYKARNYEAAGRCLQKEMEQQKITSCKPAVPVNDLRDAIDARLSAKMLLALADDVTKWEGAASEVPLLSPDSRAQLAQIKDLATRANNPDVNPTLVFNPLKEQLARLFKSEFQARDPALSQLLSPAWKPAFANAAGQPKAAACQAPANDGTTSALRGAADALKECNRVVTQAARLAGSWGCDDLTSRRGALERDSQALRQWVEKEGGPRSAAESLPGLPQSCAAFRPSEGSGAKLLEAFKSLGGERAAVAQALDAKTKEIGGALAAKRTQLRERLKVEQAKIFSVPNDCTQTLQLGQAAASLAKLRSSLAPERVPESGPPPDDLHHLESTSKVSTDEIVSAIKDGVARLEKRGSNPDVPKTNIARLQPGLSEFVKSLAPSSLEQLCTTARNAEVDIRGWLRGHVPVVTASVERSFTLVSAAARAMPPPGGPECLQARSTELASLKAKLVGGGADAWVDAADAAAASAQACLTDFHLKAQARFSAVRGGVRGALDMVDDAVAGLQAQNASKSPRSDTIARLLKEAATVKEALEGAAARFEKVRILYASQGSSRPENPPAPEQVKQAVEAAGVRANVPDDAWRLLVEPGDRQKADPEIPLLVRDAAVLPEISRSEATLKERDAFIRKLSPFAALSRAYLVVAQGDLDGAIVALREAERKGRIPDKGTAAALAHASLSHFLFAKAAALAAVDADREVLESVKQDAEHEAKLAIGADAGFSLPGHLFPSRSFRDTFQAYRQASVR